MVADIAGLAEAPAALGAGVDGSPDAFTVLNDAFLPGGTLISVPDGMVVEHPIIVEHWVCGAGAASFPRTVVAMGEDSEAHVLERFMSPADAHLVVPVTELVVGDAARLRFLGVQDHGPDIWQVALVRATVGRDATLRASAVALGGDYARLRSEALLTGAGASSEMVAVYFANENQMLDFRTLQDHDAPHTTSELLWRGLLRRHHLQVYLIAYGVYRFLTEFLRPEPGFFVLRHRTLRGLVEPQHLGFQGRPKIADRGGSSGV